MIKKLLLKLGTYSMLFSVVIPSLAAPNEAVLKKIDTKLAGLVTQLNRLQQEKRYQDAFDMLAEPAPIANTPVSFYSLHLATAYGHDTHNFTYLYKLVDNALQVIFAINNDLKTMTSDTAIINQITTVQQQIKKIGQLINNKDKTNPILPQLQQIKNGLNTAMQEQQTITRSRANKDIPIVFVRKTQSIIKKETDLITALKSVLTELEEEQQTEPGPAPIKPQPISSGAQKEKAALENLIQQTKNGSNYTLLVLIETINNSSKKRQPQEVQELLKTARTAAIIQLNKLETTDKELYTALNLEQDKAQLFAAFSSSSSKSSSIGIISVMRESASSRSTSEICKKPAFSWPISTKAVWMPGNIFVTTPLKKQRSSPLKSFEEK